jgi:hypothetical protein
MARFGLIVDPSRTFLVKTDAENALAAKFIARPWRDVIDRK